MNAKMRNPTIARQSASIGKLSAEQDEEFLSDSFFYHPLLDNLRDQATKATVILGRTGSGKTALLLKLADSGAKVKTLDLVDLTMDYVSNSDVIRFLSALGIDLDLFFQALWKHLLCTEFIRLRFGVSDENNSNNFFTRLLDRFSLDARKKRAIEYLRQWQGKFWITADENIKQLTQNLELKANAELGAEIEKFKARAGYERTLSAEKRTEVVSRAKKFVNAEQVAELSMVLDLLGEFESDNAQKCYLLIDRVDEKWVDEELRFKLIRALIECLRSFRKISNLKIVVAMRTDVYERVLLESSDVGFQREKFDDYSSRIEWDAKQLQELVDKRVRSLYRRKYTKQDVSFSDLFSSKIGGLEPFQYLLERTLFRPRDLLSFINECLLQAVGQGEVSSKHAKSAELEYSRKRLDALYDEWRSTYPSLQTTMKLFQRDREHFTISELAVREVIQDVVLAIATKDEWRLDPLYGVSKNYMEESTQRNLFEVAYVLVEQMYRVGAIGVKLHPDRRYDYSHLDTPILAKGLLSLDTKVRVHTMFHRALGVSNQTA